MQSCDRRNMQVESILAQSDLSVATIRSAMKLYDSHSSPTIINWEDIRSKASEYLSSDCSVCLGVLVPHANSNPVSSNHSHNLPLVSSVRPLSLLSCGHLLHETCIQALEKFASEETLHLCPLCRAPYQRTPMAW